MSTGITPPASNSSPTAPGARVEAASVGTPTAPGAKLAAASSTPPATPGGVTEAGSGSSPSAPGSITAAGSGSSPSAPGAVTGSGGPVSSGALISGPLSPDATGLLIDAGTELAETEGVTCYSSDGNTTPAATGRWTILRWVTVDAVVLDTYLDGELDFTWYSTDAGNGTLPTKDIRTAGAWSGSPGNVPSVSMSGVAAPSGIVSQAPIILAVMGTAPGSGSYLYPSGTEAGKTRWSSSGTQFPGEDDYPFVKVLWDDSEPYWVYTYQEDAEDLDPLQITSTEDTATPAEVEEWDSPSGTLIISTAAEVALPPQGITP